MKKYLREQIRLSLILAFVLAVATTSFFFATKKVSAPESEKRGPITSPATQTKIPDQPTTESVISFTIGGDMMFDRAIDYNFRGDKILDVVNDIKDQFGKTTVSLVNLEGPISPTDIPADNTANNMIFNFPSKTVDALASMGVNAVSLANNHTGNNGSAGLANTKKVLTEKGIVPIGEEARFGENSVGRFANGDKKLSIICINTLEVSGDIAPIIRQEKLSGSLVLVFPHWGTEYAPIHSASQETLAHVWIDAGADVVIGGHPHVIEDMAVYKDKPIFYSLGNLVFDQTFSKATQEGLILKATFSNKGLEVEILPVVSKKLQPEIATGAEGEAVLNSVISGFEKYQSGNYPRNVLFFGYNNES